MGKWPRRLFIVFLFLICILCVYSPTLTTTYLYHDDVNFFLQTPTQKTPKSFHLSLAIGRFIGAPIYAGYSWLIESIDDLKRIRFMSLLQFAAIGGIFFNLTRPLLKHSMLRFNTALMILFLPSFQVLATQAGYAFQTTGVLLSLLAIFTVSRLDADKSFFKSVVSVNGLIGCSLLILAIATHPSTSMFYWSGLGIVLLGDLRQGRDHWIRRNSILLTIGCLGMVLYAVGLKISRTINPPGDYGIYDPHSISTNIGSKLQWFIAEPFVNASNFYDIFPSVTVSLLVSVFILLAGCVGSIRLFRRLSSLPNSRPLLQIGMAVGLPLALIVLSFSTNLLAVGDAPFYRCIIALSALLLVYVITGVELMIRSIKLPHTAKLIAALSLIAVIVSGLHARQNVIRYRTKPSHVETQHLLSRMSEQPLTLFGRIHLIHPNRKELRNRYDEFGGPTSSFRGDTIGLISAGVIETLSDQLDIYQIHYDFKTHVASYIFTDDTQSKKAFRLQITSGTKTEAIHGSVPTLIIDMTSIYQPTGELYYLKKVMK